MSRIVRQKSRDEPTYSRTIASGLLRSSETMGCLTGHKPRSTAKCLQINHAASACGCKWKRSLVLESQTCSQKLGPLRARFREQLAGKLRGTLYHHVGSSQNTISVASNRTAYTGLSH